MTVNALVRGAAIVIVVLGAAVACVLVGTVVTTSRILEGAHVPSRVPLCSRSLRTTFAPVFCGPHDHSLNIMAWDAMQLSGAAPTTNVLEGDALAVARIPTPSLAIRTICDNALSINEVVGRDVARNNMSMYRDIYRAYGAYYGWRPRELAPSVLVSRGCFAVGSPPRT